MREKKSITFYQKRRIIEIEISSILYIMMKKDKAKIYVAGNKKYETWISLSTLEKELGDEFIHIHRGCLVSTMAIHDITKTVNLINGESLHYTPRKKKQLIEEFRSKQRKLIHSIVKDGCPKTMEEYVDHYKSFDKMPFAFADIEMIFDDEKHAADWLFWYGNEALAKLEKVPLEQLVGNSFGNLFSNMDSKWLRSYERATLYKEKLEMMDYSPEINTYLKIICFPTFPGHCGCILFDLSGIKFVENSIDAQKAKAIYFGD